MGTRTIPRRATETVATARMRELGLSQSQLRRDTGVAQPIISQMFNRRLGGSLRSWLLLAQALGTTVDELVDEHGYAALKDD